jgi:methylthioribulose-1-phosphate dehydratase
LPFCPAEPRWSTPDVFRQRAAELIGVGHFCFSRGWLPATSGNLSARLDAHRIAITVSGRHKGELDASGIMAMDVDGTILTAGCRPSAETELHLMLYRRDPAIGAVLHTHSVNATVLSRLAGDALTLSDYEVLKALPGIETHETRLSAARLRQRPGHRASGARGRADELSARRICRAT